MSALPLPVTQQIVGIPLSPPQIAVSLSVANDHASLPVAWRIYLPEGWANDPARRAKAGVPEGVVFRTKPEIALDQIRTALSAGVPGGVVLADAGYGVDTAFRSGLTAMGLSYIVGIQSSTSLWSPGVGPLPAKAWSGRGRPPSLIRRDPERKPVCGQATGADPARERVAQRHLAGRHQSARSPRASPPSASGRRIGITGAPHRGPRNGS